VHGYHASEELFMKIYLYPQFIHFHKSNCLQMCVLFNITCYIFFYSVLREFGNFEYGLSTVSYQTNWLLKRQI
jgi:hypothetical protein